MIESWYLAGIDEQLFAKTKDKLRKLDYNNIDKKNFIENIPEQNNSIIDFKLELLSNYILDKTIERNESLNYFISKIKKML